MKIDRIQDAGTMTVTREEKLIRNAFDFGSEFSKAKLEKIEENLRTKLKNEVTVSSCISMAIITILTTFSSFSNV